MSAEFIKLLNEIIDQPDRPERRSAAAQSIARKAHRYVQEAIALENQHASEEQRALELAAESNFPAAAMARKRAERIHHERCKAVMCVAKLARELVRAASGTLRIDESTAHTGLMPDERRMVAVMQRGDE